MQKRGKSMRKKLRESFVLTMLLLVVVSTIGVSVGVVDPKCASQFTTTDAGTPITNCTELQNMKNDLAGDYYLATDINCSDTVNWNSGAGFVPIGNYANRFTGTFDGQGYKITGLYINRLESNDIGLFGCTGSGSEIKNVGLEDVYARGNQAVGGLVGRNSGTVIESYSVGSVSGRYDLGGLVGFDIGGTINSCYSAGSVSTIGYIGYGGLVGSNQGTISNCYSTSSISGGVDAGSCGGGLVGHNMGTVDQCYSTGSVSCRWNPGGLIGYNTGAVSNSYWDIETSGQNSSAGGTGKTTAEMKQQATFVGWNFVNIWAIVEDVTYPFFQWQSVPLPRVHNLDTHEDFATIQAAINDQDTADGHTIFVEEGTYYEHVVVNKSLSLIGEDRSTTIIDGNYTGSNVMNITANNVNITGFTIQNGRKDGIWLNYSSLCTISGNNVTNSKYANGIRLRWSSFNTVSGNDLTNNYNAGVFLYRSCCNTVSGNNITNNGEEGVFIYSFSHNNTVSGNTITGNLFWTIGIRLKSYCDNNIVSGNNISNNDFDGIQVQQDCCNNIVSGNNIANNSIGICLRSNSYSNIVSENSIINNDYGVWLSSSDNTFYHNNFIDNTEQVDVEYGCAGVWDDDYPSGGNYWDDYTGMYPYAEEIDYSGIWNTPYEIDADNIDRYPLMTLYRAESMQALMTENVLIFDNGSCRLNIVMNVTSPKLSATYSRALGWNESLPDGVNQTVPETITFDSPKNLTFDGSVEVEHDPGLVVFGEIPVKSAFCNATRDQQRLSLGINVTEFRWVNMCRVSGAFVIYVDALGEFLQKDKTDYNWTVSIGPSNLNASTDRANFILTQIMFTQQMFGKYAGEQTYNNTWITNIFLPPTAEHTNCLELLGKNWAMNFGSGTYMKGVIGPCTTKSLVLTERMGVAEKEIDTTEPEQLVESGFLCYKIFNIKYMLLGGAAGCCETKGTACVDDFSWGIDLTLAQLKQDLVNIKFSDTYPINETATVGVDVDIGVEFTLQLKAHFDLKTKWLSLKRFRAWLQLQGSLIVNFDISVNATYEKTWEKHLFDWKSKKPYTFWIGVPVEVTPYFNATAQLNFKMYGEVNVSFKANATGWLRTGVGWKKDDGFYPILDAGMEVTRDGPTLSSQVYVEVTPSFIFIPTLLFYDIVGPSAEIQPYTKLHMGFSDGTFGWNLTAGLNVNAGIAFSGWFKKITDLEDYYWNIFDWTFWTFPREEAGVHDVAISNLRVPTQTYINENLTVSVDVANVGDFNDTANVTFYYKKKDSGQWTSFGWNTSELTTVKNWTGSFTTLTFNYNTTEMTSGQYFISANATIIGHSDHDPSDNSDWNPTKIDERNVAVFDVTPLETEVNVGDKVDINVAVMNKGTTNVSTLPLFVYYEGKPISDVWCERAHWVFDLKNGTTETLTFIWDTKGVEPGEYTISAEADRLLYETSYSDNKFTNGTIKVQAVPLDVSINPTSVTMDVLQSELFNSDVSGGSPPYTYQWYLDGILC